ncbi:hypothetical protein, partial [Xanthomonas sp. D-99]|uniref:hypothetical protein n=1 Tax=Xanthomonas sp. D-99 TaxID=2821273 RepID=UPI001AD96096
MGGGITGGPIPTGKCYGGLPSRKHADDLLDRYIFGCKEGNRITPYWPVSLAMVVEDGDVKAVFCEKQLGSNFFDPKSVSSPGLDLDELQSYVDFLCEHKTEDGCEKDSDEEELKMILFGTNGFIRHISTTKQLKRTISNYQKGTLEPIAGSKGRSDQLT